MRNLRTRVQALEGTMPVGVQRWHRIIVGEGQTEAEARAAYEAKHGAIGEDSCVVFRVVV
ncbi:hypothetical protein GRI38_04320 [Altererythrobacter aurantiacus]|uniref:Uncharacterized protein n=1 Tax=Parapontixanthobacter aurantiacus TaxID=1463599 RepID=A0A844ZBT2_9SPHN|nr:hypothetical protein [Parapontixanthobacter aurantiacus]MXO85248.1 hypothetical protein [Parapontixanthobacter aurantiacus]